MQNRMDKNKHERLPKELDMKGPSHKKNLK